MPNAEPATADAVRARAEAVLAEPLYWFPMRHHSPATARFLEAAILARKPKLILLEGPAEANEMIQHLVDEKTRPPVAIYSSYRDDNNVLGLAGIASAAPDVPPRFSCWYPLLAYSPEYVALVTAKRIGAEIVFIDLPHHALIKPAPKGAVPSNPAPSEAQSEDEARPVAPSLPSPFDRHQEQPSTQTMQREDDRLIVESSFYQELARVAGYRSWDEAWDTLFESHIPERDYEAFRREMACFCAAARATSDPGPAVADGTLERERFMLRSIRNELKKRKLAPEKALVACGGFHLFLDRNDDQPPPEPPPGTVYVTVSPYSFFRISELSGYAAGNRAPQYYQSWWELDKGTRPAQALIEHVVAVLKKGRREGEPFSSADAISVTQCAGMLAQLRGRRHAILDDIHDALVTCCCKGDPENEGVHLRNAMDAAAIGTKVGRVTPALGHLPVVNDFYAHLDDLELDEVAGKEKRVVFELDKRDPRDARRSVFLYRLKFLEVPIGALEDSPATGLARGTIFREKWALRWSPKVEPALIEQSLYGDTIEAAALARMQESIAKDELHAGRTVGRLVQAIDMDLPELISRVEAACGQAIDEDSRFASLAEALHHLQVLDRYAAYHALRRDLLSGMIVRCYDRACFALPDAAAVPEDQQQAVIAALLAVAEALVASRTVTSSETGSVEAGKAAPANGGWSLDGALFGQHVRLAASQATFPFMRGVFLGMLTELREMTTEELAAEVTAFAREPAEHMILAGDFLDGVMAVSRTSILLGADALIAAIDELLRAADWNSFLTMIPRMRAAFERLHERQRDALAGRVARKYGLMEAEVIAELKTSVAAGALIARVDAKVAEIMKEWSF